MRIRERHPNCRCVIAAPLLHHLRGVPGNQARLTLVNHSPYDTRALRRAAMAALRTMLNVPSRVWVIVEVTGAKVGLQPTRAEMRRVRVPKPSGDEWVAQLRGVRPEHRVLTDVGFANRVLEAFGRFAQDWAATPAVIPLTPEKPRRKRDRVADRHARAVALLATWTRKRKLADTKIKKLRVKVRYYEKKLATRTHKETP